MRGFVSLVKDAAETQELQVGVLDGEVQDGVERMQQYGFTSVPLAGMEAILAAVGGMRSHTICLMVNDAQYRLKLEAGDVAIYDHRGQAVKLTADGITLIPDSGTTIKIGSDTSSKKIVLEDIGSLIKAEIAKCTYINGAGVPTAIDHSLAFLASPNWLTTGLTTLSRAE